MLFYYSPVRIADWAESDSIYHSQACVCYFVWLVGAIGFEPTTPTMSR